MRCLCEPVELAFGPSWIPSSWSPPMRCLWCETADALYVRACGARPGPRCGDHPLGDERGRVLRRSAAPAATTRSSSRCAPRRAQAWVCIGHHCANRARVPLAAPAGAASVGTALASWSVPSWSTTATAAMTASWSPPALARAVHRCASRTIGRRARPWRGSQGAPFLPRAAPRPRHRRRGCPEQAPRGPHQRATAATAGEASMAARRRARLRRAHMERHVACCTSALPGSRGLHGNGRGGALRHRHGAPAHCRAATCGLGGHGFGNRGPGCTEHHATCDASAAPPRRRARPRWAPGLPGVATSSLATSLAPRRCLCAQLCYSGG